jgi:RNA polymerase II subunit A small phosphatase-like protein
VNYCADLSGAEPMEPMFVNDCENMKKPLLVLDMDETLIHTAHDDEQPPRAPDFTFSLDTCESSFDVYERPGVHEFLKQVSSDFEVAVWTAGTRDYAEPILDWLDRDGVITTRLYRDSCTLHRYGFYVKDLGKLNRCLSKIIIVDNNPRSFAFHQRNGIKCSDYYFDEYDEELKRIYQFLHHVKNVTDFRDVVPKYNIWAAENCHVNTHHEFVQPRPILRNIESNKDSVKIHNETYLSDTSIFFSQNETDPDGDIVMCDVDSPDTSCIVIDPDGDIVMCDVDSPDTSCIVIDPDGDIVM